MHNERRPRLAALRIAGAVGLMVSLAACAGQPTAEDYTRYEAALRAIGDLRTDRAPEDAPYSNADLVRNFSRIALRHEVDIEEAGSEDNSAANPLQRWEGPIRYRLYGSGATPADRQEIERFLARIAVLTGRRVEPAESGVNLMILITEPEERPAVSRALESLHPSLAQGFDLWRSSGRIVCAATNLVAERDGHSIVFGMIMIGAEVQGLLRRSCLHEEITQALGLGNDHPEVRPSIFNDDEEFALLTEHDEWLIRLLYDRRLRPGMVEAEALPLVREIIDEIRPEGAGFTGSGG
ncbi:MAG: DUF2927 domain-containing protein [Pseudomonadota bacterium]